MNSSSDTVPALNDFSLAGHFHSVLGSRNEQLESLFPLCLIQPTTHMHVGGEKGREIEQGKAAGERDFLFIFRQVVKESTLKQCEEG